MSYFEEVLAEYLSILELGSDVEAFLAKHPRLSARLEEHAAFAAGLTDDAPLAISEEAKSRALDEMDEALGRLRLQRQRQQDRQSSRRTPRRRLWVVAGLLGFGLAFSVSFASGADRPGRCLT